MVPLQSSVRVWIPSATTRWTPLEVSLCRPDVVAHVFPSMISLSTSNLCVADHAPLRNEEPAVSETSETSAPVGEDTVGSVKISTDEGATEIVVLRVDVKRLLLPIGCHHSGTGFGECVCTRGIVCVRVVRVSVSICAHIRVCSWHHSHALLCVSCVVPPQDNDAIQGSIGHGMTVSKSRLWVFFPVR